MLQIHSLQRSYVIEDVWRVEMEGIPMLLRSLVKNEGRLLYACVGLVFGQSVHVIETGPRTLSQFGSSHLSAGTLCGQVRNFDPDEGQQDLVHV